MKFKRQLDRAEVMAAIGEWLHRRGHKLDLTADFAVASSPDFLAITVVVEDVPKDPNITYDPTPKPPKETA